jgi:hypothetical protein
MNSAAWKADADAGLTKAAADIDIKALASGGVDRLREFWANLPPETKSTLVNSLIGGALGGAAAGGMGMMSAPEGQGLHRAVGTGTLGAILGALAGGAGTAGYHALTGGRALPGEVKGHRAIGDTAADIVVGGMVRHPMLSLGGILGGLTSSSGIWGTIRGLNAATERTTEREVDPVIRQQVNDLNTQIRNLRSQLRNTVNRHQRTRLADEIGILKHDVRELRPRMQREIQRVDNPILRNLRAGQRMEAYLSAADRLQGAPIRAVAGLPVGLGLGYLADKYIKGEYE